MSRDVRENYSRKSLIYVQFCSGLGSVIGLLKTGSKNLFLFDEMGEHYQLQARCILDFYVHESRQRMGLGNTLYQYMLSVSTTHTLHTLKLYLTLNYCEWKKKDLTCNYFWHVYIDRNKLITLKNARFLVALFWELLKNIISLITILNYYKKNLL